MSRRSPLAALREDRTVQAVAGLVVLALVARLAFLGSRVAHQDEARVGYWTVRFLVSGQYEYRPIVHGPFIPVVNRPLFALFGPSDFVSRLPMAVLGGVVPAAALLFRSRLRDSEVVALAFLLAANPVLLYYSRFMRQDVPLATFMLFAVGFAVRAVDADRSATRRRSVYAAGLAFGLGLTTKENAILYPVCWAGAALLLLDHRLFRARLRDSTPFAVAESFLPAPPTNRAFDLAPPVRVLGALAFLGANPVALVLVAGGDRTPLLFGVVVGLGGYLLAVRGASAWHFAPALTTAWVVVALPAGILSPGQAAFGYGLSWVAAALLALDERVFEYASAGAARGRPAGDPAEAVTDGGSDPDAGGGSDPDAGDASGDRSGVASTPDAEAGSSDGPGEDSTDRVGTDPGGRPAAGEGSPSSGRSPAGDAGGSWRPNLRSVPPLGVAYLLALFAVVFFYAPRGGGYPEPAGDAAVGLWGALTSLSPAGLDAVFWEATFGTWERFWGSWVSGGHQDHAYLPYFRDYANSMASGALVVSVGAAIGLVVDRYAPDGPRDLVAFAGYWGVASVLGYPLVTDIQAAWTTVHAVVPLAIPAAVALALVYRLGRDAFREEDGLGVAAAAVVLLLVTTQVGYAAGTQVYTNSQAPDNQLVQYAQSSSADMKPVLRDVRAIAERHDGVDVLFYGDEFDSPDESDHDQPPAGPGWFDRLPIAWYLEGYEYGFRGTGATLNVSSTVQESDVRLSEAPVVIALRESGPGSVPYAGETVEEHLEGYRRFEGHRYLYDSGTRSSIVIYVDTSLLDRHRGDYDDIVTNRSAPGSDDGSGSTVGGSSLVGATTGTDRTPAGTDRTTTGTDATTAAGGTTTGFGGATGQRIPGFRVNGPGAPRAAGGSPGPR